MGFADKSATDGRAFGQVVTVETPGSLSDGEGFIVRLDPGNVVVTCCGRRRGVQWDFADEG